MPTLVILANCAEYHFFHRLCIYQDRATEHLRPNSRKKKKHVCINIGIGGRGGNSLNPIQASENILILETNDCTSSVRGLKMTRHIDNRSLPAKNRPKSCTASSSGKRHCYKKINRSSQRQHI